MDDYYYLDELFLPEKMDYRMLGCRSLRLSTNRRTAHQPQNHPI